jgi:hypothetical protein
MSEKIVLNKEKILEAYKKTGLTPASGTYTAVVLDRITGEEMKCACPMTMHYIMETGIDDFDFDRLLSGGKVATYFNDRDFDAVAFYQGFDNRDKNMIELREECQKGSDMREFIKEAIGLVDTRLPRYQVMFSPAVG